jgi:hypothetical protein
MRCASLLAPIRVVFVGRAHAGAGREPVRAGLAAGAYADTECYPSGVAKVAVNAARRDPHLSNQQVESESYGQILSEWKQGRRGPRWSR